MTSADRVRLIDEVEAIRDELVTLQQRFADVMREIHTVSATEPADLRGPSVHEDVSVIFQSSSGASSISVEQVTGSRRWRRE